MLIQGSVTLSSGVPSQSSSKPLQTSGDGPTAPWQAVKLCTGFGQGLAAGIGTARARRQRRGVAVCVPARHEADAVLAPASGATPPVGLV